MHNFFTKYNSKFLHKVHKSLNITQNFFNKGLFMVTFNNTYLIYWFFEIKAWKKYLDVFITGIIGPARFCIHIFEKFWVFWIYVTKTQVLIICGILCCILGSYLVSKNRMARLNAVVVTPKSEFLTNNLDKDYHIY